MEVKIGVQHAPREIVIESTQSAEEVERVISDALAGKAPLLSLEDSRGGGPRGDPPPPPRRCRYGCTPGRLPDTLVG